MTRATLSSAARSATAANVVYPGELIDIAFPSGTIYATSGARPVAFNGNTYATQYVVLDAISGYTESSDGKARRISIKFSGIPADLKAKVLGDAYTAAKVNVYAAYYDSAWNLIATYGVAMNRLLSSIALTLSTGTSELELSCESTQLLDSRDSAVLSSPETQRLRYPGDSGLDNVTAIAGLQVEWGGATHKLTDTVRRYQREQPDNS